MNGLEIPTVVFQLWAVFLGFGKKEMIDGNDESCVFFDSRFLENPWHHLSNEEYRNAAPWTLGIVPQHDFPSQTRFAVRHR